VSDSMMNINQMFGGTNENTNDDIHGQEKEHLIHQGDYKNDQWQQRTRSPTNLSHSHSDTNINDEFII
ncbi:unnamed protein product, partial [Rotaria sp. Silwood1]